MQIPWIFFVFFKDRLEVLEEQMAFFMQDAKIWMK